MDKYNNKYRISSARAQWWDYAWDAAYFITICTKNREHFFGEVADNKVILTDIGQIAHSCWIEIPNHAKNVTLGEFVVMPNHVHGIIILQGNRSVGAVGSRHALPLRPGQMRFQNPGRNSISTIVGGYKSAVTRNSKNYFGWQTRFHDHIICDEGEFQRISKYITDNPMNWAKDRFCSWGG